MIISPSAAARLATARAWLASQAANQEVLIVGGSIDGALQLCREAQAARPATVGWRRLSLDRLAHRLAADALARDGLTVASPLALEALWTRVVHRLSSLGALGRFSPVADRPGFPRALGRMMEEARLEGVPNRVFDADLAVAAQHYQQALSEAGLIDRPGLLALATKKASEVPLLLLDVPARARVEADFIEALAAAGADVLATVPEGDGRTLVQLERALKTIPERLSAPGTGALGRLQTWLFSNRAPPSGVAGDEVTLLSAPGEARECVELARAIHRHAAAGTPFDRMAVLLRAPHAYRSPISEALRRAGIPAYFARGTRHPDPSGRALLALLHCGAEGLSASGFAEYLSLGEVPAAVATDGWAAPSSDGDEERVAAPMQNEPEKHEDDAADPDAPVVAGTLRAPRQWEKLLIDAAVIGGRSRWERRLDALAHALKLQRSAPDLEDRIAAQLDRDLSSLATLRSFALPLLDQLAALPPEASWEQWLEHLEALANASLRYPSRVVSLLGELRVMGEVGPVTLREVIRVLSERLLELTEPPDHQRFGRVFVGPIDSARGLDFDVVFAPGLAERIFPQKVREDPIATDVERRRYAERGYSLSTDDDRRDVERLQLRLAVGAATQKVVLSYPRLDAHEGRPRVPSFYALDVLKACEGRLPTYEELSQRAETLVDARLGWPAPKDPAHAIDAAERDLSVLGALFKDAPGTQTDGRARYLMLANEHLSRALRHRWARWRRRWAAADGLVLPSSEARQALTGHRFDARSFSATALQHYAACPYRFYLSAIVRLAPRQEPAPIEELDPLQRGSMVHDVQFEVMSALRAQWPPPLEVALSTVDDVLHRIAAERRELLHPAIARVWDDGIEAIRADVREWMRLSLLSNATPWKFELSFGLSSRHRADPDSRSEPAALPGGLKLRGSIDLVEKAADGSLTAVDYKTGKRRAEGSTRLGGGKTLQPVLYALALEQLFKGHGVAGGALWYCTQAGNFARVPIPLDAHSRQAASSAISIVGEAIETGFLPAAPAADECEFCDFQAVCGAQEERRVTVKSQAELQPLKRLRELE